MGERECSTGQPMTQARFTSTLDDALAPERIEERDERKAKDDEIIAVDLLEQLDADRLDLIGPDRAQHLLAGGGEIMADELGRELAHGERRDLRRGPDGLAVRRHRHRSVERVRLTPEVEQLPARRLHAVWLRQNLIAESEHLVGADDIGLARKIAHGFRLGARQHLSDIVGAKRLLATHGLSHHALVEPWRLDDEGE